MRWLMEPYLPKSRPALLAIGAKEQDVLYDGTKKRKRRGDEKRHIPLVKQESSREESSNGNTTVSRSTLRSPERRRSSRRDDDCRRRGDRDDRKRLAERTGTGTWTDIAMSIHVSESRTTMITQRWGQQTGRTGLARLNMVPILRPPGIENLEHDV
ncbi:uncharacterized protein HD556DRAFT_960346 [Suillus plorans]|uniref:Uncharacterized protein n=1 Tax=Suillus plorans TaxID=116603 RepID=A0A9P7DQU9_9AGAM|nr:uncharacterized protein HD556DRAFT_960346 [Suillus plorans]KAG1800805.1 hypothetical protein HD556DRAFT_960346 [Suillus plorans]